MDSYSSDSSFSTFQSETSSLSDANSSHLFSQRSSGSASGGGKQTNVKCRYFMNNGYCFYGDQCQFSHVRPGGASPLTHQNHESYASTSEDDSAFLPSAPTFVPKQPQSPPQPQPQPQQQQQHQHQPQSLQSKFNDHHSKRLFNKQFPSSNKPPSNTDLLNQQFRRMRIMQQANSKDSQENFQQNDRGNKTLPHLQIPSNKFDQTSFFMSQQMRMELLKQRSVLLSENKDLAGLGLPENIENYHSLHPLEDIKSQISGQRLFGYTSTCYRVVNSKDGLHYCMRRIHGFRLLNPKAVSSVEKWKKVSNSNIVPLKEAFSSKAFNDTSLIFIYQYYPGAETVMARHFKNINTTRSPHSESAFWHGGNQNSSGSSFGGKVTQKVMPERLIWSYVIQLTAAIRQIHSHGLSCRAIDPSKVLLIGNSRLRLNCPGILDVLTDNEPTSPAMVVHYQQEDLVALGKLILALACYSMESVQRESIQASIEFVARNYSKDLKTLIWHLLSSKVTSNQHSINDVMPMIGARFYSQLDVTQSRSDLLENELSKEMDNGRLLRILAKLGTIIERSELNMDAEWSETGDRYLLKLFRDYLFHQVTESGAAWIDFAHIVSTLNKLDAGSSDRICLSSRDELSILVVSYHDLKACLETAFSELIQSSEMS
ncbi:PAN2-PAN3 deadenylation complex subunit pan3-like isoform X1 [Clytia hemisphaerica]|uniref:PAN2-PAN3 deadenylation complex subunit PAN3 n=1 Tax=Clytia hemisphaerica TaxID=252671 RepID=A0A7M6DRJ3_9CNID